MSSLIPANLGLVTIRYIEEQDHRAYVALEMDSEVKRYVDGPTIKSEQELLQGLRTYLPSSELMSIVDNDTNRFVGRCGLLPMNRVESEVFCLLFKTHWKQGIGRTVVSFLANLATHQGKKVVAIVHPENHGSLALLEKLGWLASGTVTRRHPDQLMNGTVGCARIASSCSGP